MQSKKCTGSSSTDPKFIAPVTEKKEDILAAAFRSLKQGQDNTKRMDKPYYTCSAKYCAKAGHVHQGLISDSKSFDTNAKASAIARYKSEKDFLIEGKVENGNGAITLTKIENQTAQDKMSGTITNVVGYAPTAKIEANSIVAKSSNYGFISLNLSDTTYITVCGNNCEASFNGKSINASYEGSNGGIKFAIGSINGSKTSIQDGQHSIKLVKLFRQSNLWSITGSLASTQNSILLIPDSFDTKESADIPYSNTSTLAEDKKGEAKSTSDKSGGGSQSDCSSTTEIEHSIINANLFSLKVKGFDVNAYIHDKNIAAEAKKESQIDVAIKTTNNTDKIEVKGTGCKVQVTELKLTASNTHTYLRSKHKEEEINITYNGIVKKADNGCRTLEVNRSGPTNHQPILPNLRAFHSNNLQSSFYPYKPGRKITPHPTKN